MDPKIEESRKRLRKNYKKTLGMLERVCSDCHVSFAEKYSKFSINTLDSMTDSQIQKTTYEMKRELFNLIKKHFLQGWLEIANMAYEGAELENIIETVQIMIEMEPASSYEYFCNLFNILKGLSSEDENESMNTLFMIRENAAKLTTEEIISSYSDLARSKYKSSVIYAILDGSKKNANKNNVKYISCYFSNNNCNQPEF